MRRSKLESCSMELLVEAKRDGRLGNRELSSIDRHLATCASCAELARDLDRVRVLLRAPTPTPTPLELQRGRLKLLHEAAVSPPRVRGRKGPTTAIVLALAAVCALLIGLQRRAAENSNAVAAASSASASAPVRTVTTVAPESGARFLRSVAGGTETVTLESGAVTLSVRHLDVGERFLVKTGDAEVEVRGTVFRVEAADDRLRNVAVVEGKVEVRFRGDIVLLTVNERWDRPADAPPVSTPIARDRARVTPSATAPLALSFPGKRASITPPPPPSAKPAAEDGTAAFVEGMGMMERGDYGAAAHHLEAFSQSHPGDDRAEDAAFLVILALQRAGRPTEAAAAARRYLSGYPAGFRRAQARAIAEAREIRR